MTCKDSLIAGVRQCSEAPGTLICSVIIGLISIILHFVGILSDYWLQSGSVDNNHQGLWNYCRDSSGYECCSTLSDHVKNIAQDIPGYVVATQVFIIMGFVLAFIAFLSTCVILFSGRSKDTAAVFCTCPYVLAVLCLLVTVSVYGGQYQYHDLTKDNNLHFSFGFTVTSMFLYMIAFGLSACCSS